MALQTERLELLQLTEADAPFILDLLNSPGWLRYIGDRGVRTIEDAKAYIQNGPAVSYAKNGFGLYLVRLKNGQSIGLCGLIRRDTLPHIDIGFAFLPDYSGRGYGFEASQAVIREAQYMFGLERLVAITDQENMISIALLHKLGFQFERLIPLNPDLPELSLFGLDLMPQSKA